MRDTTEINSRPYQHGVVHIHGDRANCEVCGDEMSVTDQAVYPVYDADDNCFICNTCYNFVYKEWATPLENA